MTQQPLVSVVLPCFNAQRFVDGCIRSLTTQDHRNIEVIALDDGSTDQTAKILASWACHDGRVRVISQGTNRGLISTLNQGVSAAKGAFIARMDADDIAAPTRLTRQLAFLLSNPSVDLVGTGTRPVDADTGRVLAPRPVRCLRPVSARLAALFTTPVSHMTVLARSEVMRRHPYGIGNASLHAEDYELWTRMLAGNVQMANLEEPLVTVRADRTGVSLSNEELQIQNFIACARHHLKRMTGLEPPPAVHRVLVNRLDYTVTPQDFRDGLDLLDYLYRSAAADNADAVNELRRTVVMQRLDIVIQALIRGGPALRMEAANRALRLGPESFTNPGRRYVFGKLRSVYVPRYDLAAAGRSPRVLG